MQKYKKYVEVLDIYSDTYEPTELQPPISRCPSVIKLIPTISNKSNQENMILIIVVPTVFSVIVLFYIAYKMYCLKYRINIKRELDENFGTEINNTIDF